MILQSMYIFHAKFIYSHTFILVGPDRQRGGGARALARGETKTVGGYAECSIHSAENVEGGKTWKSKGKSENIISISSPDWHRLGPAIHHISRTSICT